MIFKAMAASPRLHERSTAGRRHIFPLALREFGHTVWTANVTGLSSMLAYNMLLGIVPLSLLGLFVSGQVLASNTVEHSIERTLQDFFPGTTKSTLDSLLQQVAHHTATTGIATLVARQWLGSSFWGSLDTAFSRIYGCQSRSWLRQKRFALGMVLVLVLLLVSTVATPTLQSLLRSGAVHLPYVVRHVHAVIYVVSLGFSLGLLFLCLSVIYMRVPNIKVPWHATWPGALAATIAIGIVALAFPVYLGSVSTIARYSTAIVFIVIVLGWFWVVALVILCGAVMNSVSLKHYRARGEN
jgi:membrane protein